MLKITFVSTGGPNDGNVLYGALGDGSDAERYYLFTNHGAVRQRFRVASQFAVDTLARKQLKDERRHYFQQHFYLVVDRFEGNHEVWERAEYAPNAVESNRNST